MEQHRLFRYGRSDPEGEFPTAVHMVAQEDIARFIGGDTRRRGVAEGDSPQFYTRQFIDIDGGGAISHADDQVVTGNGKGRIDQFCVGRHAQVRHRIHVEELLEAGSIETVIDLLRYLLHHRVFRLVHAVCGNDRHLEPVVVVMRLGKVRGDGRMRRAGSGSHCGREIVRTHEGHLVLFLVNEAADRRIDDVKRQQLGLGGMYPLAGDDNVPGFPGSVSIGKMILFRQIQDIEAGLDLAVGLQFGLYACLDHIDFRLVIGRFRVIERDRNHEARRFRIRDIQLGHFLVHERTESEIGRQGCDTLPFCGGQHIFGLMAG